MTRRGSVALALVVALAAACLPGAAAAATDHQVTLTVTVVDGAGEPVGGGVTVEATWDGGGTTGETAANGRVFVDVPEGTDVELDVDDDQYIRNQPRSVADADERDVELRVSPQGTATVTVTDTGGEPLSDATVRLRQGGEIAAAGGTDDDGVYRSDAVEQGQYRLQVVKPGFYRVSEPLEVGASTETGIDLEAGRVTLDVTVFDDHFAEPRRLTDARVVVEGRATAFDANVSASDGSASLNVPVNARYRIVPAKPGYVGAERSIDVREDARSVNVTAQRAPELVVSVSSDRVVVGETTRVEVTNAYDEPVPNATVRLDGTPAGTTDDRGEVSVRIDDVGERTIAAGDGDLDADTVTVVGVDPESDSGSDAGTTTATASPEPTGTDGDAPGFGAAVAVAALLIAVGALVRRG